MRSLIYLPYRPFQGCEVWYDIVAWLPVMVKTDKKNPNSLCAGVAAATGFNLSPNDYKEGLAGPYRRPPPQNAPDSHVWFIPDEIIAEI